jgi:hypothetical protein
MSNPLKIAPPPRRRNAVLPETTPALVPESVSRVPEGAGNASSDATASKFRQVKEDERVQFNKRVTRGVSDGFEMLAIKSRKKVPELLAEALELLEQQYGQV